MTRLGTAAAALATLLCMQVIAAGSGLAVPTRAPAASSQSSATAAGSRWLVKGQDLGPWDPVAGGKHYPSIGLKACAAGAKPCTGRETLPSFTWVLCGRWKGKVYGRSDYTTCHSGSTPVFENYDKLADAIKAGMFTELGLHYAIYDIESWKYTPVKQKDHPVYWIGQAVSLAKKHGISLIVSPGGSLGSCARCWQAAATAGAYMVGVQSQGWGYDSATQSWKLSVFAAKLSAAVRDIRKARDAAGTSTLIMAGLGTNTPSVHSVSVLGAEYSYARTLQITRFWINANNWAARNRCDTAQGGLGCPEIGVRFLAAP
jgi:hypothetical protein